MPISTAANAARYRPLLIEPNERRIRITNYHGTKQEPDLSEPANCRGFGRTRHFSRVTSDGWVPNPLPIDPAARALGIAPPDQMRAQVFQNAACNWRCWYCFVPFELLSADPRHSDWFTSREMVDLFLAQASRPSVLDLSGGEPELTPEWVPWVLEELRRRDLDRDYYVWSDDNLSTDYFWKYLSPEQQELVVTYPNYGRVGCFKGIDEESFAYNTNASQDDFKLQFELMRRLIGSGMDVYAYVTFTTPDERDIHERVDRFVDRLQEIDPHMPLRTVPLEIKVFTPVESRLNAAHAAALRIQWTVLEAWRRELDSRFSNALRSQSIVDVPLVSRN